ncbi:helix-turn-helix transcriptional regulator [Aureimonas sp. SA4125]|uniref:helix-turn-helix transcriptional regulator n=1 Tax=Aureimonas sp. SA4125 TaxID=2826993 RepID=UPI001CC632BF|nr:helix-turn-helix transcriptional regulator [Aureimonas sp. SA4125]
MTNQFARPVDILPRYSAACLQMVADGYTLEDTARYIGCDIELVWDVLELARRRLGAANLEQSVAAAMKMGLIV